MARRIARPIAGPPAPERGDAPLDETERRLLEDPELADYLREKRAEAARIAGEARVERDRKG